FRSWLEAAQMCWSQRTDRNRVSQCPPDLEPVRIDFLINDFGNPSLEGPFDLFHFISRQVCVPSISVACDDVPKTGSSHGCRALGCRSKTERTIDEQVSGSLPTRATCRRSRPLASRWRQTYLPVEGHEVPRETTRACRGCGPSHPC